MNILTLKEKKKGQQFFILKLCFLYILSLLLIFIICHFHTTYLSITLIASCILGILLGHATGLQHEAAHGIFTLRKTNHIIGFLLGFPLTIPYTYYRIDHMKHHIFLGTPKNNEIFVTRDVTGLNLTTFIKNVLMIPHYKDLFYRCFNAWFSNSKLQIGNQNQTKHALIEFKLISLWVLVIISLSFFYRSNIFVYLWVIPVFFIALPIRSLIEIAEHFGCDTMTTDVFKNCRVIPGKFATWLTNGNNYHVVHHLYPTYPLTFTRRVYNQLTKPAETVDKSYILFYLKLIKKMVRNNKLPQ